MVHSFYIDYLDEGHYMYICIESEDLEACYKYLEQYSKDVRYSQTKEKKKTQRGKRKTEFGTIVSANMLEANKITTFGKNKIINAYPDRRCIVWD